MACTSLKLASFGNLICQLSATDSRCHRVGGGLSTLLHGRHQTNPVTQAPKMKIAVLLCLLAALMPHHAAAQGVVAAAKPAAASAAAPAGDVCVLPLTLSPTQSVVAAAGAVSAPFAAKVNSQTKATLSGTVHVVFPGARACPTAATAATALATAYIAYLKARCQRHPSDACSSFTPAACCSQRSAAHPCPRLPGAPCRVPQARPAVQWRPRVPRSGLECGAGTRPRRRATSPPGARACAQPRQIGLCRRPPPPQPAG